MRSYLPLGDLWPDGTVAVRLPGLTYTLAVAHDDAWALWLRSVEPTGRGVRYLYRMPVADALDLRLRIHDTLTRMADRPRPREQRAAYAATREWLTRTEFTAADLATFLRLVPQNGASGRDPFRD